MKKRNKITFLFLLILVISGCSESETVKSGEKSFEIPLFSFESIEPNVIYISHSWLNKRSPTLIKMRLDKGKMEKNITLTECEHLQIGEIEVSDSKSFQFNLEFGSFPKIDLHDLEIRKENRSRIQANAYFFVIPGHKAAFFLDSSNIHSKSGKKVLNWLKENIFQLTIYEAINIWSLEHGKEPDENELSVLKKQTFKLDELIHLNRTFE